MRERPPILRRTPLMTMSRPLARGLAMAALVVVLDQLTKWWILEKIMVPPRIIEVTSFFNLVLTWEIAASASGCSTPIRRSTFGFCLW